MKSSGNSFEKNSFPSVKVSDMARASSSYLAAIGTTTLNGPGIRVATLASGGNSGGTAGAAQGSVTDGATTTARSFSMPSASTVGPASTESTRSSAQPRASPSGMSM